MASLAHIFRQHQQANGLAENAAKQMQALLAEVDEDGSDFYLALLSEVRTLIKT